MTLDDQQKNKVREWVSEGLQLNDIQKKLSDELGVTMTYMDLRFLISDLEVTPADPQEENPEEDTAEGAAHGGDPSHPGQTPGEAGQQNQGLPPEATQEDPIGSSSGSVSVSVDSLARPGYAISGQVTFSDGKNAEWFIDEMGRPGINPEEAGYRPSQEDIMKFQVELQKILSQPGAGA